MMEGKMNFSRVLPLKHLALVKVTTELWNLSDIRDLVARTPTPTGFSGDINQCFEWQAEEDKVRKRVPELPLPESLKQDTLNFIRPVGLEIHKWKAYLCDDHFIGIFLLPEEYMKLSASSSCLCWTPQGTIDRKKTAKALVKDDNIDITKRYVLACHSCLEDDIKELWNLLPERRKEFFYSQRYSSFSTIKHHTLAVLWTHDIKGELTKLNGLIKHDTGREISAYQFAFEISALSGNKTAAEYFWQKLTPLERKVFIIRNAKYLINRSRSRFLHDRNVIRYNENGPLNAEVWVFLLSQMNEDQQLIVLKISPCEILSMLLNWPWQSFFLEAANRTRDFLSEQDYALILRDIVRKITSGYKDYNYHKLFGEVLEQGPSTCKGYLIGTICDSYRCLSEDLFQFEDKEIIKLIFENATVEEREKIVFQEGKKVCLHLICSDNWDLVKFFLQKFLFSKDIMVKFKTEFQHHIDSISRTTSSSGQTSETEKYTKFFRILDDMISGHSKKREMEDGTNSPAKRLK